MKEINGSLYILPFYVKGKSVYDSGDYRIMTCVSYDMAVYFSNLLNKSA